MTDNLHKQSQQHFRTDPYLRTDSYLQSERQGRLFGWGIALLFHLVLVLFFVTTGFRTIYPIPRNDGILVEFLPEPLPPVAPRAIPGEEPRAPIPDPNRDVRLVQQAIHTEEVQSEARTQQSTLGETGDVELHEPEPPQINDRALFRSRDRGDSLAEQSSRIVGTTMQAGAPDGNTRQGNPDGTPVAKLEGRYPQDGALPLPEYKAQDAGMVVVDIVVDQYGKVTNATFNPVGSTTTNKTLTDAAIEAAKKAKFNISASAPVSQKGTITYVFTLK